GVCLPSLSRTLLSIMLLVATSFAQGPTPAPVKPPNPAPTNSPTAAPVSPPGVLAAHGISPGIPTDFQVPVRGPRLLPSRAAAGHVVPILDQHDPFSGPPPHLRLLETAPPSWPSAGSSWPAPRSLLSPFRPG
ncbi:unnamed protein product, partial [Musa banksii]